MGAEFGILHCPLLGKSILNCITVTVTNSFTGIEVLIPTEKDLMENGSIEFNPYNQSNGNVFAAFLNMTPTYVLPHAVIINQINKTGIVCMYEYLSIKNNKNNNVLKRSADIY